MAVETVPGPAHGHGEHHEFLHHQFEDIDQQNESYVVGMWTFLVTEIMFFGALFLTYSIYRMAYPAVFADAHHHLNVPLGTLNTFVLLFSSFTMVLGVRAAQLRQRTALIGWLSITIVCAFAFLGVKAVEYTAKYHERIIPGPRFVYPPLHPGETMNALGERTGHTAPAHSGQVGESTTGPDTEVGGAPGTDAVASGTAGFFPRATSGDNLVIPAEKAQLFFSLYFAMTGLHAIHIIIGIVILGTIVLLAARDHPSVRDFIPIEMAGLYWHFVDVVWIFLFPLLYLIGN